MTRNLTIRPFVPEDYDVVAEIMNSVMPDYALSASRLRHEDENREAKHRHGRFIGEIAGQPVAVATYESPPYGYHPRKFLLDISVRPEEQRKGIGTSMYDHLVDAMAQYQPAEFSVTAKEDLESGTSFCRKHGFTEAMREWELRIDLHAHDSARWQDVIDRARAEGITVTSFAELPVDVDWQQRVWECSRAVGPDVPSPQSYSEPTFDFWLGRNMRNPMFQAEAYTVAVHDGEIVGINALWHSDTRDDLYYTGLTGVRREYRRKGVALAMKLRGLRWAKEAGASEVRTWNATYNEGMLAINERLGFVRQPAWIDYVKVLDAEHPDDGPRDGVPEEDR